MDDAPSSPEVPAPDLPPTQPVEPQADASATDSPPNPPPEPPPSFWASRKYIGRAFGFNWHGLEIEGSFYQLDGGSIDCDGLVNGREFESTTDLMTILGGRDEALIVKIRSFLT